jgi:uncharacterized membrane protein
LQKRLQEKAAPAGEKDWEVKAKQFIPAQVLPDEAAAMASMKPRPNLSVKMRAATLTPDIVEKIYMPKFRLFARGEPAYAGIGAIFNAINLRLAREELKKSNHFNETENRIKFDNAVAGLAASVAQYSAVTIERFEKGAIQVPERLLKWGSWFEFMGMYGGAVVGVVAAAFDAYHAWDDAKQGNIALVILDLSSAAVGLAMAGAVVFLSASAAAVVGLPLLLLAAAIGVLMNYFKGREVYDWLERCYFGLKARDERFSTLEEDRKAFTAMVS